MAIEIRATPLPGEPWPEPPVNSEGMPFQHSMVFNGGTAVAWADSASELVGVLIAGYLDIPEADLEEQATQRACYAVGAQVRVQARILAAADAATATEEEMALLSGSRDTPPELDVWRCPIPLVLVDAFYEPYTETRRRPVSEPRDGGAIGSNIIWLNFADEVQFLDSLVQAGEIARPPSDQAALSGR